MAVYPLVSSNGDDAAGPNSQQAIDVEAWSHQAAQSLNAVSVTTHRGNGGRSVSLAIYLDEKAEPKGSLKERTAPAYQPRRKLLRRDSLERREALLRGKEGSRRRTRWDNGS